MNLLNLLKYQLGTDIAGKMANFLGEQPQKTKTAIDATLPALMSVFVKRGETETGANHIMDTIKLGNHDGNMLNHVAGLFKGSSSMNSILSSGNVLANKFLGDKKAILASSIAHFSGISSQSADTLIRVCTPLTMGIIGKQVKNQNLDAIGLKNLLSVQKGHIGAAIPAGFSIGTKNNPPVITPKQSSGTPSHSPKVKSSYIPPKTDYKKTSKESVVIKKTNITPPPKSTPITATPKVIANKPKVSPTPNEEINNVKPRNWKKFFPFILISAAVLLTLLFIGLRGCSSEDGEIKKKENEITTNTSVTTPTKTDENPSSSDIGNETQANESNETETNTYNPSTQNNYNDSHSSHVGTSTPKGQLLEELSTATAGTSISLDGLNFRNKSSMIRPNSRHLLKEVAQVMQSNPSMNIQVESNPVNRAISFKKGLMDLGIDRNRIHHTEGGNNIVQLTVK